MTSFRGRHEAGGVDRVFEQREARRVAVLFASAIVPSLAPAARNTRTMEG